MKTKKLSTIILTLFSFTLVAKEVPKDVALKAATFYFKERCAKMETTKSAPEPTIKSVYPEISGSNTLYYVVNYKEGGFVIIAANDASIPILGYSTVNSFDKTKAAPALVDWFTIYEASLKEVIRSKATPSAKVKAEWTRITSPNATIDASKAVIVGPLLTSTWDQNQYYNALCPFATGAPAGYDYHVPNGCVALSTAQAMYYNRYPNSGTGSYNYNSPNYGTLSANYGATTYDWNAMTNSLTNYNTNVATLIYHIGVGVDMNYDTLASSSYTQDIPNLLKNHFGYSSTIAYKNKIQYNDASWIALFKSQLDARHPMVISGASESSGGHAFNCDGYDDQEYFHFNWGWGGYSDGYFLITNLNPGGADFTLGQAAIINIFPQTAPPACEPNVVLTAKNGSLEDGSRFANYASNLDCQWVIAPSDASAIEITFSRLNTEAGADSVVFYNGETTSSPIYASFSGNTIPASFTINSSKVLVRFITNHTNEDNGWLLTYSATTPSNYCSSIKLLTNQSGTITDGSTTNNYLNTTYCKWFLQPLNATSITLTFTDFNLATDDQLTIFDRTNSSSPVIMKILTGDTLPSAIYCNFAKLGFTFQADNKNTGGGFSLNWASNLSTGVNEIDEVRSIALFPNPASNSLKINMQLEEQFEGTINILDIRGQTIFTTNASAGIGTHTETIDLSAIASGLYLVNLKGKNGQQITMKFSKQ